MPRFLTLQEAVAELGESKPPRETELAVLRNLQARTARAHGAA